MRRPTVNLFIVLAASWQPLFASEARFLTCGFRKEPSKIPQNECARRRVEEKSSVIPARKTGHLTTFAPNN